MGNILPGGIMGLFLLWFSFWFWGASGAGINNLSPRVVFTKQGPVQGILWPHLYSFGSTNPFTNFGSKPIVEVFKGIPYASPPTGSLRYENPTPLAPRARTEVFSANVSRPACPRTFEDSKIGGGREDSLHTLRKMRNIEDCLYLDLYAPLNNDKSRGRGLPVLAYMNSEPDSGEDSFDGSSMAAIGNIIVISIRYRVGVLGFLQPGLSNDVRTNFGLWDQLAALQWIKENIEEFGGDPKNVCLMGNELDANMAGVLAFSPVTAAYEGLFQRLILLNGSPFSPISINAGSLETTVHLARALRCQLFESSGELLDCFRKSFPANLLAGAENIGISSILSNPFGPVVDGVLVKDVLPNLIALPHGRHASSTKEALGRFDILAGIKEGPTLPKIRDRKAWSNISLDRFVTAAIKFALKIDGSSEPSDYLKREVIRALVSEYGTAPPMKEILSDFLLVYPMVDLLNTHSKTGRNTFFYLFKDFDPLRKNKNNEVSYIFSESVFNWKYDDKLPHQNYFDTDLHPFELLISLIANFVKYGDPNQFDPTGAGRTRSLRSKPWPKYNADSRRYLELGREVEFPSKYRNSQMNFWAIVFPAVLQPFASNTSKNFTSSDFFFPRGGGSRDQNVLDINQQPPSTSDETITSLGQSSIVIIGSLLLLLNFLCFLGLYYQRQRLKKAEIALRKRYFQTLNPDSDTHESNLNSQQEGAEVQTQRRLSSFFQPINFTERKRKPPMSETMSETETENGFGPDFLGPNYDPRTKVSRWMMERNRRESPPPFFPPVFHNVPGTGSPHPNPAFFSSSSPSGAVDVLPRNYQFEQVPFVPRLDHNETIPYVDSRGTTPSVQMRIPSPQQGGYVSVLDPTVAAGGRRSVDFTKPQREMLIPARASTLIVREYEDDSGNNETKLVPVKTGTLKRSVAVGIENNGNKKEDGERETRVSFEEPI